MYTELASSRVHMIVFVLPSALSFLHDGKVRGLAVTSRQRSPALPDLPTVAEAGLPGAESETMYGFLAPAKTPGPLVKKLNADIVTVLRKPEVRVRFESQGAQPTVGTTPEAFEKFVRAEYENFAKLITAIGLTPQ